MGKRLLLATDMWKPLLIDCFQYFCMPFGRCLEINSDIPGGVGWILKEWSYVGLSMHETKVTDGEFAATIIDTHCSMSHQPTSLVLFMVRDFQLARCILRQLYCLHNKPKARACDQVIFPGMRDYFEWDYLWTQCTDWLFQLTAFSLIPFQASERNHLNIRGAPGNRWYYFRDKLFFVLFCLAFSVFSMQSDSNWIVVSRCVII